MPLGLAWFGLDVPFSMEQVAREDRSAVTFYGGVSVPYADAAFDLVVSIQVFEHVPQPHTTFAEIARILRPSGYLLGSTSFNEPFHSESTFGYSPKNFARMIDECAANQNVEPVRANALKLELSGQFNFLARKR